MHDQLIKSDRKDFYIGTRKSISNKCCSFELYIHHKL